MREGVDYAWGRPSPVVLKRYGKDFVLRYVSTPGNDKNIDNAERKLLQDAGIDIAIVFETTANRALGGYAVGRQDAYAARKQVMRAGGPADGVIYFAADVDVESFRDFALVNAYLRGAASVLGKECVGVYGEYDVVKSAHEAGVCKFLWQTYAWSHGEIYPYAHLWQYHNGVRIDGVSCDLDRALRPNFGQWYYEPPEPVPGPQEEEPFWLWLRWSLGEGEFKGHGSDPSWRPLSLPKRVPPTWWIRKLAFLAARKVK